MWSWFKYNRLKWSICCSKIKMKISSIPVQNDNWVGNPDTQNWWSIQCTECDRIDWATNHNKSTVIKWCRVWIINSLSRSGRLHMKVKWLENVLNDHRYWGNPACDSQNSTCACCDTIEGKVWHLAWTTESKLEALSSNSNIPIVFVSSITFSIYLLLKVQIIIVCVEDISETAFHNLCLDIVNPDSNLPETRHFRNGEANTQLLERLRDIAIVSICLNCDRTGK
jgi:hypothetical protein